MITSARHRQALSQALRGVQSATEIHAAGSHIDLLAIDLTTAANALGEITGETVTEDLLETIFGQFCVGK
jgi:tRNA modification GTPase